MNVLFGQLPTDSHDGATVVNRNIVAGRGQARNVLSLLQSHLCAVRSAYEPLHYQEMLHERHDWPVMPVQLQHGARAVESE